MNRLLRTPILFMLLVLVCACTQPPVSGPDLNEEQWFIFRSEENLGYLHIAPEKNIGDGLIEFTHKLLVGVLDGDRTVYKVTTLAAADDKFTPLKITIKATEYTADATIRHKAGTLHLRSSDKIDPYEGILAKGEFIEANVDIPVSTTTDLLLFSFIEKIEFDTDTALLMNLIESLELHLKKNIVLLYKGRDAEKQNLHKFDESSAVYWLDDSHRLIEVLWDKDKSFIRSTEAEAMTILQ